MHYFGVPKLCKMVSQWNQPFYPTRPQMMFESVSEHFANFSTSNEARVVFWAWMIYFEVPKLRKWFHNEIKHSTPLEPKRCLMVFRSFSKNFGTWNEAKLVFRTWMHYFRVPKLRKWFRNKINHSTALDPKRCLRVFRSITQTFDMSNETKVMFRAWMHYFGVPELRKRFRNKINQSTPLDPKGCLRVFRSISQTFGTSNVAKVVFRAWMHYFEVPMLQKWFRSKINNSTILDLKRCLRVFRSISKTFGTSNEEKLVFRAWMHYFGIPKLQKWFRNKINHSTTLDLKRCLRVFRSISQTSAHQTRQKLCSGPECTIWGYTSCKNGFATKSTILPH